MTTVRDVLAFVAIGSSAALGCALDTSPEPDITPSGSVVAVDGGQSVQGEAESAAYWYERGRASLARAEAGDFGAYLPAREALETCVEKDPHFAACLRLLSVMNRPRPGCGFACGGPAETQGDSPLVDRASTSDAITLPAAPAGNVPANAL